MKCSRIEALRRRFAWLRPGDKVQIDGKDTIYRGLVYAVDAGIMYHGFDNVRLTISVDDLSRASFPYPGLEYTGGVTGK